MGIKEISGSIWGHKPPKKYDYPREQEDMNEYNNEEGVIDDDSKQLED